METQHFQRDFFNQTTLHPVGLMALIVLGALLLTLPRRQAIWPLLLMVCFVASAQRVVILTLDFTLLRFLLLLGLVRVLMYREFLSFKLNGLDIAMFAFVAVRTIAGVLLYGTFGQFVNRMGGALDILGSYLLVRFFIVDWSDMVRLARAMVLLTVPIAGMFLIELATQRNLFGFFGGVGEVTKVRDGRLRAQGAFAHPILAGCFFASMMPLMAALWWRSYADKLRAFIGCAAASVIIVACASSTPVLAVLTGMLGAVLFVVRRKMAWIRWGVILTLIVLHFTMNAPVWHLIGRLNVVGGSTGYHRYRLLDEAINRVGSWGLIGSKTGSQEWGQGLFDVTNHYLLQGLEGGLLPMALFVLAMALGFRAVGRMCRTRGQDRRNVIMAWALGVSLFVHAMNFVAVSYFGQIVFAYYMVLGVIGSLSMAPVRQVRTVKRRAEPRDERPREPAGDGGAYPPLGYPQPLYGGMPMTGR